MEIVLKRIAKKNTYTIGRLYILADEDVDRKVVTSYNQGLKREFRDSFDEQKLGGRYLFLRHYGAYVAQSAGRGAGTSAGGCPTGQGFGQEGAEDEGPHRHPRGHVSRAHHPVAEVQAVVALSAGRSEF